MYKYETQRPRIFTERGVAMLTTIRDTTHALIKTAGAVRLDKAIAPVTGETWDMLACMDYLVEIGEIKEITGSDVTGQHRVFVSRRQ